MTERAEATVIIAAYNPRLDWLLGAVDSAQAQTVPVEIVVVDDGSDTPVVDLPDGVRLVRHEKNLGIAAAYNTGIRLMTTPYFVRLDQDDIPAPEKIEVQLAALHAFGASCCCHSFYALDANDNSYAIIRPPPLWFTDWRKALCQWCCFGSSTPMIARTALEAVKIEEGVYFDPGFHYGQDWELWLRLAARYEWIYIDTPLSARREQDTLTSRIQADPQLHARKLIEDIRICAKYGSAS